MQHTVHAPNGASGNPGTQERTGRADASLITWLPEWGGGLRQAELIASGSASVTQVWGGIRHRACRRMRMTQPPRMDPRRLGLRVPRGAGRVDRHVKGA